MSRENYIESCGLGEILIERRSITRRISIARSNCSASAATSSARFWSTWASSPIARRARRAVRAVAGSAARDRRSARRLARNRNALAEIPAPVPLSAGGAARSYGHAGHGRSAGFRNAIDRRFLHRARRCAPASPREQEILDAIDRYYGQYRQERDRAGHARRREPPKIWNTFATWPARRRSSAW